MSNKGESGDRKMRLGKWPGTFIFLFVLKILFIHERHTERGRDIGRERSRLPVDRPDPRIMS